MKRLPVSALVIGLLCALPAVAAQEPQAKDDYEIGGPLAGVKLPLFPTQHGEPAGYPGCLPDPKNPAKLLYDTEGLSPERQLYPGSVEHWRANDFKYLPTRSLLDGQTLRRNWLAPELARLAGAPTEPYAEPLYWNRRHAKCVKLAVTNAPAPVVRCRGNGSVFALDCGELDAGMYAVSVVGAVPADQLEQQRRPLYLRMDVNDAVDGSVSHYRLRLGYCDQFYSVAEIYFHAPEKRAYRVQLYVSSTPAQESRVDLLVHNIELHDVLAGRTRRAIKTRMTMHDANSLAPPRPETAALTAEERRARDAAIWNEHAPLNAQPGLIYGGGKDDHTEGPRLGAAGKTPEQIVAEYGDWAPGSGDALAVNKKLNLAYTFADYRAGRPLPDPYPFKDDGAGLWYPPVGDDPRPQNWFPIAQVIARRSGVYLGAGGYARGLSQALDAYVKRGDVRAGRDAAVALVRAAYDFPALVNAQAFSSLLVQPGAYGKDWRCRQRIVFLIGADPDGWINAYDLLFGLLSSDADLAHSIGRFVPWVKTPSDVIKLLDVYLVQERARRYMRYHGIDANNPALLASVAAVFGDQRDVTDPWLEWVFNRTWVYPLSVAGLPDMITSAFGRDGMKHIGSFYYAQVEEASKNGELMEGYINAGGNPKFDLRDPRLFPKVEAACDWFLTSRIDGLYFPRIGDVTGPVASYGYWFDYMDKPMRRGWRWTRAPRFAWMLAHYFGRKDMTDAEWAEVEKAAAQQPRAPFMENRSRVLPNWFGVLEAGTQYDDFRFRRAAFLRVGQGYGHGHNDTLDMQFYLHGLPMTLDGGQRPGYSSPGDSHSRVHNVVEVDGRPWLSHAWVTALSDVDGARYLAAQSEPAPGRDNVRLFRRQIALVDVDEGSGYRPLTAAEMAPGFRGLDPGVITPNSYIFDVFRVEGGKVHTYCFHGPCYDQLDVNLAERQPLDKLPADEKALAEKFPKPERIYGGDASDTVVATWRYPRAPESNPSNGCEQHMARTPWSDDLPRKFTRLHLLGQQGARVLVAPYYCKAGDFGFDNVYTRRRSDQETAVVFPAIIEPYVGKPFIAGTKLLSIDANETDARAATAVEVQTTNGHTDVLFADGRPDRVRSFRIPHSAFRISSEFACVSRDADGLRVATLTGGTLLDAGDVVLRPATRERNGKVVKVDYAARTMSIDPSWPAGALLKGRVFEVGVPGHWMTYTIAAVARDDAGSAVRVVRGADYYLARVADVDPAQGLVYTSFGMAVLGGDPCPGLDKHWVATNEDGSRVWRADYLGGDRATNRYAFKLTGGPVAEADFGRTRGLRLWEYGAGDTVRQSTFAAVRRTAPGVYELTADVDVAVTLAGKTRMVTVNELAKNGGRVELP